MRMETMAFIHSIPVSFKAGHGNRVRVESCATKRCSGICRPRHSRSIFRKNAQRYQPPFMQVELGFGQSNNTNLQSAISEAVSGALSSLLPGSDSERNSDLSQLGSSKAPCLVLLFASCENKKSYELLPSQVIKALTIKGVSPECLYLAGCSTAGVQFDQTWSGAGINLMIFKLNTDDCVRVFQVDDLAVTETNDWDSAKSKSQTKADLAFRHIVDTKSLESKPAPFSLDWRQSEWFTQLDIENNRQSSSTNPLKNLKFLLFSHSSFPVNSRRDVIDALDFAFNFSIKVGGSSASSSSEIHDGYVFLNQYAISSPCMIGIGIDSAELDIDVAIAQGAKQAGPLLRVDEVEYDTLKSTTIKRVKEESPQELRAAPLTCLDMWKAIGLLTPEEAKSSESYLLMGVAIEPSKPEDGMFATRKVLGMDNDSGSMAINGIVRPGQLVAFQIRDKQSALDELSKLLIKASLESRLKRSNKFVPVGALLFTDEERGSFLFGKDQSDAELAAFYHDFAVDGNGATPLSAAVLSSQIGPLPAPGFASFLPASGDGVIRGGQTFQHDACSAFAIFYAKRDSD